MTLTYETIRDGDIISHRRHGQPHRLNGPAVWVKWSPYTAAWQIYTWYQYGKYINDP
jgi:hypothetical protein